MASIQETLAKIKDDELRRNSLNFNDAYDSILQEERANNADITKFAQEVYEKSVASLDETKKANTRAAIAENALDTSLAFANASRSGISKNVAGQTLSQGRQQTRVALANQQATDSAARNQQEQQRLSAIDLERQRDAQNVRDFQAGVLSATQAAEQGLAADDRLDARTIASEYRGEARTNRLQDKQLERDTQLTAAQAQAQASSLDPNIAAALGIQLPEGFEATGTTENNETIARNATTGEEIVLPASLPSTGSNGGDLLSKIGRGGDRDGITSGPGFIRSSRSHGLDIGGAGKIDSPIPATVNGEVIAVGNDSSGFGKYVILEDSDGVRHRYSHLNRQDVSIGDTVSRGQSIGLLGNTDGGSGVSTGPHLDYTVYMPENPGGVSQDGIPHLKTQWGRAVGPEVPLSYIRG